MFQGLKHLQVAAIDIYQSQYKDWYREAKGEKWKIFPSLCHRPINSYLHIKRFLYQEKNIELLGGWCPLLCKDKVKEINKWLNNQSLLSIDQKKYLEKTPDLEKEGPVVSTSSKTAPEKSKDKLKGPQRNREVPETMKEKPIGTDLTHKGKGFPNWSLHPWKVYSIWSEPLWSSQPRKRKG
ncbi:hypothetical protein O181_092491 [Austropuccinia psidii MF-1]|uniref:Uncharacterized protein n=1 Tax=Austropuccinia psidii MF-1 TaxID=1389203 RepID=A0A9Q3IZG0_9BASI|nr:hypothetical protein [Austropuccinia psidii MF-1]